MRTQNIPENAPLRESSSEQNGDSKRVLRVDFNGSKTRFRESSNKPPRKPLNTDRRSREYLTPAEVERLIKAAELVGRHGHRDGTILLLSYLIDTQAAYTINEVKRTL